MLFKALFNTPFEESVFNQVDLDINFNSIIAKEIIIYNNHEFEIQRDEESFISELTFCNQCVQTFDIEEVLIELISKLLVDKEIVTLIDSNGSEEILSKDELLEML